MAKGAIGAFFAGAVYMVHEAEVFPIDLRWLFEFLTWLVKAAAERLACGNGPRGVFARVLSIL